MLSAPAGRMTCLLLSNHLQITCFRSAASSKDSLNLLSAFPSLVCTVHGHWNVRGSPTVYGMSDLISHWMHHEGWGTPWAQPLAGSNLVGWREWQHSVLSSLDKSGCWSEPRGYVSAGYNGLHFQQGSCNYMAFGSELNFIWLRQSSLYIYSEEQGTSTQHTPQTCQMGLQKLVVKPIQVSHH